jgi:hypothetical protein
MLVPGRGNGGRLRREVFVAVTRGSDTRGVILGDAASVIAALAALATVLHATFLNGTQPFTWASTDYLVCSNAIESVGA